MNIAKIELDALKDGKYARYKPAKANRDTAIHQDFYFTLSAEVHPTAELLFEFIQRKGFVLHRDQGSLFTMYMAGYVLYLVWREVAVFPLLSMRDRRDARHALTVTREAMLTIVGRLKPFAERASDEAYRRLFLNIYSSLMEPYNDEYWQDVIRSGISCFTPPAV
jgi:hypothetical protein